MPARFSLGFLLLLVAASVLPLAAAGGEQDDARPHARNGHFFERLHDFGMFPVGRGRIGAQIQPMTPELRAFMGAPEDRGVLVERVVDGSPAEAAGLRVGDVITEAGGEPIDGPADLIRAIHSLEEGEDLELTQIRDGKRLTTEVTPEPASHRGHGSLGEACEKPSCSHHGHRGSGLERRLDEVEERLRELEKHILPGMDNAETAT